MFDVQFVIPHALLVLGGAILFVLVLILFELARIHNGLLRGRKTRALRRLLAG